MPIQKFISLQFWQNADHKTNVPPFSFFVPNVMGNDAEDLREWRNVQILEIGGGLSVYLENSCLRVGEQPPAFFSLSLQAVSARNEKCFP